LEENGRIGRNVQPPHTPQLRGKLEQLEAWPSTARAASTTGASHGSLATMTTASALTVRLATEADLPDVADMVDDFVRECQPRRSRTRARSLPTTRLCVVACSPATSGGCAARSSPIRTRTWRAASGAPPSRCERLPTSWRHIPTLMEL